MMINFKKYVLAAFFILTCSFAFSQSAAVSKKVKKAEQKKEELKRKAEKAEEKGRKRHEAIQTKETRKRMKKHRRSGVHVHSYEHRPFFIKRWFHKKEHGQ